MEAISALLGPDTGSIVIAYLSDTRIGITYSWHNVSAIFNEVYHGERLGFCENSPVYRQLYKYGEIIESHQIYNGEEEKEEQEGQEEKEEKEEKEEIVSDPHNIKYTCTGCKRVNHIIKNGDTEYKYVIEGDLGECTIKEENYNVHYKFKVEWIEGYRDYGIGKVPFDVFNFEVDEDFDVAGWKEIRYGELTFTSVGKSGVFYYSNGKLNGTYEFGSWMRVTYVDGLLHGPFMISITDDEFVSGTYSRGMLHGEFSVRNSIGPITVQHYSYGLLHGLCELYNSIFDEAITNCNYSFGLLDGCYTIFYQNNKVHEKKTYVMGKLHGFVDKFHENGQLKCRTRYVNDVATGYYEQFYDNGNIAMIGDFDSAGKLIIRREWYVNGFLRYELINLLGFDLRISYYEAGPGFIKKIRTTNSIGAEHGKAYNFGYTDEKSIEWSGEFTRGLLNGDVVEGHGNKIIRCHFVDGMIDGELSITFYKPKFLEESETVSRSYSVRVYNGVIYGSWRLDQFSYDSKVGCFKEDGLYLISGIKNASFEASHILAMLRSNIILEN